MKIATLFIPGSYGTFISWCVYSFSSLNRESTIISPFDGSSAHAYRNSIGNSIVTASHTVLDDSYQNYILIDHAQPKFINYISNQLQKASAGNLAEYLESIFPKIYTKLSAHWSKDYSTWEMRELLSFYLDDMFIQTGEQATAQDQLAARYNCYSINPEHFILNIDSELIAVLDHFGLAPNEYINDADVYAAEFIKRQDNFNKDEIISNFVEQTILGKSYEFQNQTIFDQAWIQHQLRLRKYEIQCYNLNEFPMDSSVLSELLIK